MTTRWLAFAVAAVLAVGAGSWLLRNLAPGGSAPSSSNAAAPIGDTPSRDRTVDPNRSDPTRVPGAYLPQVANAAAPVTSGDRFKLVGVVAPRESVPGSQWVALIAVDGEQARAFSIGATIEGDIVLRDVSARGAIIGPREGSVAMALDALPAPATGMAQAPASGLDSPDAATFPRSKYMPLQPQPMPEPENRVDRPPESDDGRWRPSSGN
ncbi:MAG TPA: type II secretion system protein N [Casimicrobiaceae bacterium]|nr:type II secretion system protein N [Casimicrobiaceae bacterium]